MLENFHIKYIIKNKVKKTNNMDLEKIKIAMLKIVDSIAKSLGVELRVLVLIAFLVGYILGRI